jgi:hypothetical protein
MRAFIVGATIILARFSIIRVLIWALINLAIFIPCCIFIFVPSAGQSVTDHLLSEKGLWNPLAIATLFMVPLLLSVLYSMFRQIVLYDRKAIWIRGEKLYFLNFYGATQFSSLLISDIDSLSVGSKRYYQPRGIVANLKSGYRQYIPTILLADKRTDVFQRLGNALVTSENHQQ